MTYELTTHHHKILADTLTPVSVYLKLRDKFPHSVLLESSDFRANDNTFSYICCNPIASFSVKHGELIINYPDEHTDRRPVTDQTDMVSELHGFSKKFKTSGPDFKFINNGLFGYTTYDAVRFFEDIEITVKKGGIAIPDIHYAIYQNIIAINHFKNEAHLFAHCFDSPGNLDQIIQLLQVKNYATYPFNAVGDPSSNMDDRGYEDLVKIAKKHCLRGDVFQLVFSRRFAQHFKGDDFNVYRALRSINPSPYLFYFDYGDFKIFGSSPEAQLIVHNGKAEIHPIAGTFRRTGNDEEDAQKARELAEDPKENSEHVMLVDLARNDLSRHGTGVNVENYKEVQFFSHVIHLVSRVTGQKKKDVSTMQLVADTFPAGTLSGAPKHRAMQLIDANENVNRGYYGGAIGFMDFKGNYNHAIMIRTFLSKDHQLYYQAGAGLVEASEPKKELQETYNKLRALSKAISLAETI